VIFYRDVMIDALKKPCLRLHDKKKGFPLIHAFKVVQRWDHGEGYKGMVARTTARLPQGENKKITARSRQGCHQNGIRLG